MINHKIKLAFVLFVVSIIYFSGSSLDVNAEEIIVCHKQGNNYVTKILIDKPLQPHLNHGDFLGACEDTDDDGVIDPIDNCPTVPNSDQGNRRCM